MLTLTPAALRSLDAAVAALADADASTAPALDALAALDAFGAAVVVECAALRALPRRLRGPKVEAWHEAQAAAVEAMRASAEAVDGAPALRPVHEALRLCHGGAHAQAVHAAIVEAREGAGCAS